MAETPSADPWREQLDEHLGQVGGVVERWVQPWADAQEPAALTSAAAGLAPSSALSEIGGVLVRIEAWYGEQHDAAIYAAARAADVSPRPWSLRGAQGWIAARCRSELGALEVALRGYREAVTAVADHVASESGVWGVVKGFARGYANPLDGLAGLFGQDSASRELQRLNEAATAAGDALDRAQSGLLEQLDTVVVSRWNDETVGALGEIEEAAQAKATIAAAPGASWRARLRVVLAIAFVGAVLAGGAWLGRRHLAGASASPGELTVIEAGQVLRAGPNSTFAPLEAAGPSTAAFVLDRSVPGWIKVRTSAGREGWIETSPAPAPAAAPAPTSTP